MARVEAVEVLEAQVAALEARIAVLESKEIAITDVVGLQDALDLKADK